MMLSLKLKSIAFLLLVYVAILPVAYAQLGYTQNLGQWHDQVHYRVSTNGGFAFLDNEGITLLQLEDGFYSKMHSWIQYPNTDSIGLAHSIKFRILGAEIGSEREEFDDQGYAENYFTGNDPARWASNVRSFERIRYNEIYSGIDLIHYSNNSGLKHDFIVKPLADPSQIEIEIKGAEKLELIDGDLVIHTTVGQIAHSKPFAYQHIDGRMVKIPCRYKLKKNLLFYEFPDGYDENLKLVIDPELAFSSYIGSSSSNFGFTASYDNEGNLFGGAIVFGPFYPTTFGAIQFNWATGVIDCGISKFNQDGTDLLYSTYFGGENNEAPHSIIVNEQNELYILGSTSSLDFPVAENAYQSDFAGGFNQGTQAGFSYENGSDIFVAKFNANGTELLGSTFVGGSGNDGVGNGTQLDYNYGDRFRGEIVVDSEGNAYVASVTGSADFPIINGYSDNFNGSITGVIFKLNNDLSDIVWSTYTGGNSLESARGLQLAQDNSVYFTGGTTSIDLPTSTDAYQAGLVGSVDGYIGHISADGSQLLHCTYNGTPNYDQNYFVQLDDEGNVYVVGQSASGFNFEIEYPISDGVYSNPNSGQYIHKFSPDLTTSIWSTQFGSGAGLVNISPSAFLVSDCGELFVSGWGGSVGGSGGVSTSGMPISGDAFQSSTDGNDFYLIVLSPDAQDLVYATYFGGGFSSEHVDGGTSRFDKSGTVYQSVCAGCGGNQDFPTQPGVWSQTNPSTNCNLGVFKFKLSSVTAVAEIDGPDIVCPGTEFELINQSVGADSFTWFLGDVDTSFDSDLTYSFDQPGTYDIKLVAEDSQGCLAPDSVIITVVVEIGPDVSTDQPEPICPGETVQLAAEGAEDWEWFPADDLNNATIPNPVFSGSNTTELTVVGSNQCGNDTATVTIVVGTLDVSISDDVSICPGESTQLSASGGSSYSWSPPFGLDNTEIANPIASPSSSTTYNVDIETAEGCVVTETVEVEVLPPAPTLFGSDSEASCNGDPVVLIVEGADNYSWTPVNGLSNPGIQSPTANPAVTTTYTVVGSNSCGEDSFDVTVYVSAIDVDIETDSIVCANEPFFLRASGATNYVWQPDHLVFNKFSEETQAIIELPSLITVTGIDSLGCRGSESVFVQVYPRIPFRAGNDRTINYGDEIMLETFSSYPIQWEENQYISCTNCNFPIVNPPETTSYFASITTPDGCPERDTVTVFVRGELHVPNAFTPDGDGLNEIFKAEGLDITEFNMKIFNRWGELIFESNDINHGWNGASNNGDYYSPPGIYQYIIVAQEHKGEVFEYRGFVQLLR